MPDNDVTQISVNGNLIGIIGLQSIMESMVSDYNQQTDELIGEEIVKRVEARNYVPGKAKYDYAKALVREFRKFLGQPVEEEPISTLRVLILGPGCANCSRLEKDVRDVMDQIKVPGEMIHITDVREIGKYGFVGLPALVINKKIVSAGIVPDKKEIRQWIEDAIQQKC